MIDENPTQSLQPKTTIFSLPTALEGAHGSCSSLTKLVRRKDRRPQRSQDQQMPRPTSLSPTFKTAKIRQLSVSPPFPSPLSVARSTARKASAPLRVFTPKYAAALPKRPDPTCRTTPTTTADRLGVPSHCGTNTPHATQSPLGLALGQAVHPPQRVPHTLVDAITPPPLPAPSSEPVVVPSTPVQLSPRSSLEPIADFFTQSQLQSSYFFNASLVSPFDCSGTISGLASGGLFPKSAFETLLGSVNPSYAIPPLRAPDTFYANLFNTYAVF